MRNRYLCLSAMLLLNASCLVLAEESSYLTEMQKLAGLKKQNKITDKEFESQKNEIKKRFFEQAASSSSSGNNNVAADNKVVVLGDTKQIVRLKLGVPFFDGGYYWKYSSSEAVYFDENDEVREVVGFSFALPETLPIEDGIIHGKSLISSGSYSEALNLFEKLDERRPNHSSILYNLGIIHSKLGNKKQSILYFEKALELEPSAFKGDETVSKAFKEKMIKMSRAKNIEMLLAQERSLLKRANELMVLTEMYALPAANKRYLEDKERQLVEQARQVVAKRKRLESQQ